MVEPRNDVGEDKTVGFRRRQRVRETGTEEGGLSMRESR